MRGGSGGGGGAERLGSVVRLPSEQCGSSQQRGRGRVICRCVLFSIWALSWAEETL